MQTPRFFLATFLCTCFSLFLASSIKAQQLERASAPASLQQSTVIQKKLISRSLNSDSTNARRQPLVEKFRDFLIPQNIIYESADGLARHYKINEALILVTITASASGRVYKSDAGATPTKLSGGLLRIQNQSTTGCTYGYRGWTKYNISSINDASTINDVDQYVYCTALVEGTFDFLNYDIFRLDSDPEPASGTSLWNDIANGAQYENDELVSNPPDWEWSDLNSPGDADLQSALVVDWFGLGYMVDCTENDPSYYAEFQGYDATASARPYLAITYTPNSPPQPVLISPSGSLNSPIICRWYRSLGAISYRLQVARDNGFTDFAYNQGVGTDTSHQVSLSPLRYYWRAIAANSTGMSDSSAYLSFDVITSVEEITGILPQSYSLSQNYPNPFNPMSTIEFSLPKQSRTKLIVYDVLGREIERLVDEQLNMGVFKTMWDGTHSASGLYYYRLIAIPIDGEQPFVQTRKMILAK